jgi:hypothetical protein
LKSSYNHASSTAYPIVKTNATLPTSGKVRIDLELKTTKGAAFWLYHTTAVGGGTYRLWRLESGGTKSTALKVFDDTSTGAAAACDVYNTYTIIMDNTAGTAEFYLNGTSVYSATMPKKPTSSSWQLYFKQANDATLVPTVTRKSDDTTIIESVTDPEYIYVKSIKVTTGSGIGTTEETDTEFESCYVPITTNIYLDKPLGQGEVISYKKDKLPTIPTHKGTSIVTVDTTVQPSRAEIVYYSNVKE